MSYCIMCSSWVRKNNCVNANNPEKHTKAKNAAKQGNAGERPDAVARYTVKSSEANSLLFYFTGIFRRINSGVRVVSPVGERVNATASPYARSDRGASSAQNYTAAISERLYVALN